MVVVDASVVVTALTDQFENGGVFRKRLQAADQLAAPHLLDIEVLSALRHMFLRKTINRAQVDLALADLGELDIERWDHGGLLRRAWDLHNLITAYDAIYVALAEEIGCPLVTGDFRLAKSAEHAKSRIEIELLRA